MAFAEMFFWWYKNGWSTFINKTINWLSSIIDFFSMGSLIRTLFKPYRQISAEVASSDTALDTKFHMFIDRLISRIIGFFSRLIILIIGTILIIIGGTISFIIIIIWPLIPFIPIAGIILSVNGVTI